MALAFRCKSCGRKYRNVSIELSGRRVRCECGRTQRLMTAAAKRAHDRIRKNRRRNPEFELLERGDEKYRRPHREVFDLQSQSVVAEPDVDEVQLKPVGLSDTDDHVDLRKERKLATLQKEKVSTLPTLPPGFLAKSFRPPPVKNTHNKILDYLGIASGVGAALLGAIVCFLGTQMILAGTEAKSFVEPIVNLHPPLGNDLGVKVTGLAVLLAAVAMAVGGIAQLTGSLMTVADKKQVPRWPDGLVSGATIGFVLIVCLGLVAVFQVGSQKLSMRENTMNESIEITLAQNEHQQPGSTQFIKSQKDQFQATQLAVKRAFREMLWKTLPLCLIAILVATVSCIRFRYYQEVFDFG